jgi:3-phosphoshikimate 1-carboxyvinyltransferase
MISGKELTSFKSGPLKGRVKVPGDKSMSHRALMLASIAVGRTEIEGLLEGEDVLCTAAAMRKMGASIDKKTDGSWVVDGVGKAGLSQPDTPLDMGNSGTSARLMLGLVSGYPIDVFFIGDNSLSKRPMGRVIRPLERMGAKFPEHNDYCLPLRAAGTKSLEAINYRLPVASAQVKSAIILAGLNAITTKMTDEGLYEISIDGGQSLSGCELKVPADPSSAAFPVAAAILSEGSEIYLPDIGINERRTGLYKVLADMGADIVFENKRIEAGEPVADISIKGNGPLKGIEVSPEIVPSMIDEFPVLSMIAACAEGTTYMSGLAELRIKESDRLLLVAEGLKACGVNLEMGEDSLVIHGNGTPPGGGALINTELDHRIAMSFLVLGGVSGSPVKIDDGSVINTSFPGFADLMNGLGTDIS